MVGVLYKKLKGIRPSFLHVIIRQVVCSTDMYTKKHWSEFTNTLALSFKPPIRNTTTHCEWQEDLLFLHVCRCPPFTGQYRRCTWYMYAVRYCW